LAEKAVLRPSAEDIGRSEQLDERIARIRQSKYVAADRVAGIAPGVEHSA
jgi:hypothetical protein